MNPVDVSGIPSIVERGPHQRSIQVLLRALVDVLTRFAARINQTLPKDGTEAMTGPLQLATYTQTTPSDTRPAASASEGKIIYVSDVGEYHGSDGTTWNVLG